MWRRTNLVDTLDKFTIHQILILHILKSRLKRVYKISLNLMSLPSQKCRTGWTSLWWDVQCYRSLDQDLVGNMCKGLTQRLKETQMGIINTVTYLVRPIVNHKLNRLVHTKPGWIHCMVCMKWALLWGRWVNLHVEVSKRALLTEPCTSRVPKNHQSLSWKADSIWPILKSKLGQSSLKVPYTSTESKTSTHHGLTVNVFGRNVLQFRTCICGTNAAFLRS